jgi:hypothetical protein
MTLRGGAALTVDAEGVNLNLSLFSVGRLAWSEIERAGLVEANGNRFVALYPRDPRGLFSRLSPLSRLLFRSRLKKGLPFYLSERVLAVDGKTLLSRIREQFRPPIALEAETYVRLTPDGPP